MHCRKGHLIATLGTKRIPSRGLEWVWLRAENGLSLGRAPDFCFECGSETVQGCDHCSTLIVLGAKYCGGCGHPLPWTETGLAAAHAYTEENESFTSAEKRELNESFKEITANSVNTPLVASRLQKFIGKAAPSVGAALLDFAKNLATSEAKKHLGI